MHSGEQQQGSVDGAEQRTEVVTGEHLEIATDGQLTEVVTGDVTKNQWRRYKNVLPRKQTAGGTRCECRDSCLSRDRHSLRVPY